MQSTIGRFRSEGRDAALKFLYQSEMDRIYFFSDTHFNSFMTYFGIEPKAMEFSRELCSGVYAAMPELDALITRHARNWALSRMAVIDRAILRLASLELKTMDTPFRVVLDEAVELSKRYGSAESSAFVNGILDAIRVELKLT